MTVRAGREVMHSSDLKALDDRRPHPGIEAFHRQRFRCDVEASSALEPDVHDVRTIQLLIP